MIWMTQLVWALQGDVWYEDSPVIDATVYVLDERLQSTSVQTDQNGHFDFSNIIDKTRRQLDAGSISSLLTKVSEGISESSNRTLLKG